MMLAIKRVFALAVAVPIFLALTWFFGIYAQPQGTAGAGFAFTLIALSAVFSIIVYAWLMRPGPKVRFRNRGVEGFDKDWGMGLTGYGAKQGGKRRRDDDPDPDSLGGRRGSGDVDGDGDADGLY